MSARKDGRGTRAAQEPSIPAVHVLHLLDVAARWNVAPASLLDGTELDHASLSAPEARVDVPTLISIVERGRRLTGEPGIGIHVGRQMTIAAHGHLGFAAMAAKTIGGALELATRFAPTRTDALGLDRRVVGREAALCIEEHCDLGSARDAVLLALVVGIAQIGVALTGRALQGHFELRFAEPDYVAALRPLVGRELRFAMPENRIVFDNALLDLPLVMHDPVALELARRQCEEEMLRYASGALAPRVRALIAAPERGTRSLEEIARLLGISGRTLKRRLASESTGFVSMVDEHRRSRAEGLLDGTRLSIEEIADRLGYADAAGFTRAFRRWHGTSPAAYRRRGRS